MTVLSPLVAGTWRLHEWGWSASQRRDWIAGCIDRGVSSFDLADLYGGWTVEALFGEALTPALRERSQLVTKCGIRPPGQERGAARIKHYDSSAAYLRASVEQSLAALRTDRVELLLVHRPDPLLDPAEVAEALLALQRAGKVRAFGVSNFSPTQFSLLDAALPDGAKLASNQIELHPLHSAPLFDGTLDQALQLGRRPMLWSPLAGGRLLGGDDSPAAQRVRWVLGTVSARLGTTPSTLAIAWGLRHPSRPHPVVGTRHLARLQEALDALALPLDRESWSEILQAARGFELP